MAAIRRRVSRLGFRCLSVYSVLFSRSTVRLRSLGSGHTSLNLLLSEQSNVRQKRKDYIVSQQSGTNLVGRSPTFAFWRKVGHRAYTKICIHLIVPCGLYVMAHICGNCPTYVVIAHTRLSDGYKSRLDTRPSARSGYAQLVRTYTLRRLSS